jgi:hypothetical protein
MVDISGHVKVMRMILLSHVALGGGVERHQLYSV